MWWWWRNRESKIAQAAGKQKQNHEQEKNATPRQRQADKATSTNMEKKIERGKGRIQINNQQTERWANSLNKFLPLMYMTQSQKENGTSRML